MGYFEDLQKLKLGQISKIGPEKKAYTIPKVSAKKQAKEKEAKPEKESLEAWFIDRSKEMTGHCIECGEPSTKGNETYWKFSIAHILPKATFKSITTHPLNFIELCYFGKSHHTNFDNRGFKWAKEHMPKAWALIVKRFKLMYPSIAENELKFIPDILLQELEP